MINNVGFQYASDGTSSLGWWDVKGFERSAPCLKRASWTSIPFWTPRSFLRFGLPGVASQCFDGFVQRARGYSQIP